MKTESEILFERLCRESAIPVERIDESEVTTPDYEITLSAGPVLVEVKQLEPNAEDKELLAQLRTGKSVGFSVDMGRVRLPIMQGVKQLRPHAKGKKPAIVVLYDTIGLGNYLDPYCISFSMYGPEKVHYDVPQDPRAEIQYRGMSRGGNSVATKNENTTLSAVGVLYEYGPANKPHMDLFHNFHASVPLDRPACAHVGFRQFEFAQPTEDQMPVWVEWKTTDD